MLKLVAIDMETPVVVATTSLPSSHMISISSLYFINRLTVWGMCTAGSFFLLQAYPQLFIFFDVSLSCFAFLSSSSDLGRCSRQYLI